MPTFAEFTDLGHLVLGLHVWAGGDAPFPAHVLQVGDGRWLVELDPQERPVEAIQELLEGLRLNTEDPELGWSVQVRAAAGYPPGEWVPLAAVVDGTWVYRDPQRRGQGAENPALARGLDPSQEGTRYILAARDREGAQRLLDTLTESLAMGIQAFAWPQEVTPAGEFRYFWMVTSNSPPVPYSVLTAADRAWWGPLTSRPCQVFIQWPFCLDLAPRVLQRITWGPENSIVLLSNPEEIGEEPSVLVVSNPQPANRFSPLIDVASLQIREPIPPPAQVQGQPPEVEFDVHLRLVEGPEVVRRAERVTDLKQEIRSMQLLLARLEGQPGLGRSAGETLPEPLYLYLGEPPRDPGEPAMLPTPLQRLSMEWTDQPRDLGHLRYLQLAPGSLPEHMVGTQRTVHVLTTGAALGEPGEEPGADMVGLRLRDYRPEGGGLRQFHLLPEWARFGLRIFVPAGQGLRIYPEIPVCSLAADKLAAVLLPAEEPERDKWCILLSRLREGQTQVCRIRGPFRKLVEAARWNCHLEVALPEDWSQKVEQYTSGRVDELFVESMERAFQQATSRKVEERLEHLRQEVARQMENQHRTELSEVSDRARNLSMDIRTRREWLENVERECQKVRTEALELARLRTDFDSLCQRLDHGLEGLAGRGQALSDMVAQTQADLDRVQEDTQSARTRIAEARQVLRQLLAAEESAQGRRKGAHRGN